MHILSCWKKFVITISVYFFRFIIWDIYRDLFWFWFYCLEREYKRQIQILFLLNHWFFTFHVFNSILTTLCNKKNAILLWTFNFLSLTWLFHLCFAKINWFTNFEMILESRMLFKYCASITFHNISFDTFIEWHIDGTIFEWFYHLSWRK